MAFAPALMVGEPRVINDVVVRHHIVIPQDVAGRVIAIDRRDGRTVLPLRTFACAAVRPKTDLFRNTPFRSTPAQATCPGLTCRVSLSARGLVTS